MFINACFDKSPASHWVHTTQLNHCKLRVNSASAWKVRVYNRGQWFIGFFTTLSFESTLLNYIKLESYSLWFVWYPGSPQKQKRKAKMQTGSNQPVVISSGFICAFELKLWWFYRVKQSLKIGSEWTFMENNISSRFPKWHG